MLIVLGSEANNVPNFKCRWTLLMSTHTRFYKYWKGTQVDGSAGFYCHHRPLVEKKPLSVPHLSSPVQSLPPPKFRRKPRDECRKQIVLGEYKQPYSFVHTLFFICFPGMAFEVANLSWHSAVACCSVTNCPTKNRQLRSPFSWAFWDRCEVRQDKCWTYPAASHEWSRDHLQQYDRALTVKVMSCSWAYPFNLRLLKAGPLSEMMVFMWQYTSILSKKFMVLASSLPALAVTIHVHSSTPSRKDRVIFTPLCLFLTFR